MAFSKFGMAIASDGATIQQNPLVNAIGLCVMISQMMLLITLDASAHLAKGVNKDAEYLATEMPPLIQGLSERDHKDTKLIHCKGRMRLNSDKVAKLKHRYSAVRMKYDMKCGGGR